MAQKTSQEILGDVLSVLNQILSETKKNDRTSGKSNVPGNAGVITADGASIEVFSNAMKVLSNALPPLTKITEKQYDTIANGLKKLGSAIREFGLDKNALSSISAMLTAIVQIHQVISGLVDNFLQNILKFNPLKGFILGKHLGKFYGWMMRGMIKSFVKEITQTFLIIPKDTKEVAKQVINFKAMTAALLSITKEQILQLWFMGVMLGPKIGKAIGGFFEELINKISGGPGGSAKASAAAKVSFSISVMIATLTLSLVALVILFKQNKWEDLLGGGLMLLGIVALALGIIKILSSKWFNNNNTIKAYKGIYTILALIGGLTLALAITVLIAKKNKWEDILFGTLMLGAVIGFALLILKVLSGKTFEENALKGLAGIGSVILLILGMTLALTVTVSVAKRNKWEDIIKGVIMLGAVIGFAIATLWVLSRDTFQKNIVKGLLGVGAIVLMVAGISGAMLLFGKFLTELNGVTDKTIKWGIGLTVGMITGMGAIAFAAGALITGPQAILFYAGFAAVETIAIMIASISGAMLMFTNFLKKVSELKTEDIEQAIARITEKGGMIDCLMTIVNSLDENIRGKAAPKIALIGMSLRPLITSLSQFVDVVQKMASLSIANEWDKNGKPIGYIKLNPEDFKTAAANLTESFSTFLSNLSDGLKSFDVKSLAIMQLLFPRQSKISKFFTGEKPGIGAVIHLLSDFIDIIWKMASLNVPDEWDKNGNPISYRKLKNSEFGEAALTLSTAFGTFISELGKGLKDVSVKSAVALEFLSGPLNDILVGIGAAFNPIIQIAAGKLAVGNEVKEINVENLKQAGKTVVDIISEMINPLSELSLKDINHKEIKNVLDDFSSGSLKIIEFINSPLTNDDFFKKADNGIKGLHRIIGYLAANGKFINLADKNANSFEDALEDFADGISYLQKLQLTNEFEQKINNIIGNENPKTGMYKIIHFLNNTSEISKAKANSKHFEDSMKNMKNGLNNIIPFLKSTPEQIKDIANAIKELDVELVEKEAKRTKAIQSISSNFKNMAENVQKLNDTLSNSLDLMKQYDKLRTNSDSVIQQKGAAAIVSATEKVRDTVQNAFANTKDAILEKTGIKDSKNAKMQEFAEMIANAVTTSLDNWAKSTKDLTVTFDQSSKLISGSIEMG